MTSSFGANVTEFGNVVIFTAEDDEAEMTDESSLDPNNDRANYYHELRVVALPNAGGSSILQNVHGEFTTSLSLSVYTNKYYK